MCGVKPRHALALSTLRPLHESGEIILLDHAWDCIDEGQTHCNPFWDFHHHNAGRQRLAERFRPKIAAALGEQSRLVMQPLGSIAQC